MSLPSGSGSGKPLALWQKLTHSWATKSLAVGAVATVLDITVLLFCAKVLRAPTPVCAATGVLVGSTLAFFLNRRFAFQKKGAQEVGPQFAKFAVTTGVAMAIHAVLVGLLTDRVHVPVVAKLISDVLVFSVGQLFVLRYVVFPPGKRKRSDKG